MIIIKKINIIYKLILIIFSIYVLLDTFVLSSEYKKVEKNKSNISITNATTTDTSYEDNNLSINLKTYRENNTNIYVAYVSNLSYLKTAFARDTYGKNVTEKTSEIASDNNAILAINGDFYGARESGYVLKNGIIYRDSKVNNQEDLVIYKDGSMEIINESDITLQELLNKGAYNVLSFGPSLIKDGNITVTSSDEVGKAMASNPRTAIGLLEDGTLIFVVSDGRTSESDGLSLLELANFMKSLGCTLAYNLDGGGSSTMYFNGNIINNPTTTGKNITERKVSDIVYIGY